VKFNVVTAKTKKCIFKVAALQIVFSLSVLSSANVKNCLHNALQKKAGVFIPFLIYLFNLIFVSEAYSSGTLFACSSLRVGSWPLHQMFNQAVKG
jgi:hypothetical protein